MHHVQFVILTVFIPFICIHIKLLHMNRADSEDRFAVLFPGGELRDLRTYNVHPAVPGRRVGEHDVITTGNGAKDVRKQQRMYFRFRRYRQAIP